MTRTLAVLLTCIPLVTWAQSKKDDIPVEELPPEVKAVLEDYVKLLRSAPSLDEAAKGFVALAGGSLVNEDGKSLRGTVQGFGLKKDYENVKFYADPMNLTRVNVGKSNGDGFGPSAIKGKKYKIWLAKKEGANGVPAPITILVPEGHATITTPKVVNIGSL